MMLTMIKGICGPTDFRKVRKCPLVFKYEFDGLKGTWILQETTVESNDLAGQIGRHPGE